MNQLVDWAHQAFIETATVEGKHHSISFVKPNQFGILGQIKINSGFMVQPLPAQFDNLFPTGPSHLTVADVDPVTDQNVVFSGLCRLLEPDAVS